MITINKGLDVPITGEPSEQITEHSPRHVAIVGYDYIGMKPTMNVKVGDTVAKGQPVYTDKKRAGVIYTAPASGKVVAINRGERRVFESLVIEIDNQSTESSNNEVTFNHYNSNELANLDPQTVEEQLNQAGEWTSLRTRPFSRTPELGSRPSAIFVTAMDTNPLAMNPARLIKEEQQAFNDGLAVLSTLTPKTYVCYHGDAELVRVEHTAVDNKTEYHAFKGVHPAGNAGTHIHFLHPVSRHVTVWTIGYQDVIAIGKLFTTGKVYTKRWISLAGPAVKEPRIIVTERGADITELVDGELKAPETQAGSTKQGVHRVISGSVLSGRKADPSVAYLGRFHNQVSVLQEGYERPSFHFFTLGLNRFSKMPIYLSQFFGGKKFNFTTSSNGSPRAMVPIGAFEKVMPQDYLPTQLLKSLIVEDIVQAVELGVILRDNLTRIEMEG
ncbi:MAG: NADH:ubiquinone reductase (Na(+)-transporting) subunit A [Gammaproteobacteria bacterium]|nr:MAG: NADH:ubiquinone reductase (Na(+)-transporting) subunit A [Gammaproteobacteria bacterium]